MTRTVACLIATALGVTTVASAQGGVAVKGGFSYGNVSNRGVPLGSQTWTYRLLACRSTPQ